MNKILKSFLYLGAVTAALSPAISLTSCSNKRIYLGTIVNVTEWDTNAITTDSFDLKAGQQYTFRMTLRPSAGIEKISRFRLGKAETAPFPFNKNKIFIRYKNSDGTDIEYKSDQYKVAADGTLEFDPFVTTGLTYRIVLTCNETIKQQKPYAFYKQG